MNAVTCPYVFNRLFSTTQFAAPPGGFLHLVNLERLATVASENMENLWHDGIAAQLPCNHVYTGSVKNILVNSQMLHALTYIPVHTCKYIYIYLGVFIIICFITYKFTMYSAYTSMMHIYKAYLTCNVSLGPQVSTCPCTIFTCVFVYVWMYVY